MKLNNVLDLLSFMAVSHLFLLNCTGPLMIALQYNDLFDLSISTSTNTDALPKGRAFTFIKVGIKLLGVIYHIHGHNQMRFIIKCLL